MTATSVSRMVRMPEVLIRTGLSTRTIYYMIKSGTFPTPIKLSKRAVGWREDVLEDWLDARESA